MRKTKVNAMKSKLLALSILLLIALGTAVWLYPMNVNAQDKPKKPTQFVWVCRGDDIERSPDIYKSRNDAQSAMEEDHIPECTRTGALHQVMSLKAYQNLKQ